MFITETLINFYSLIDNNVGVLNQGSNTNIIMTVQFQKTV